MYIIKYQFAWIYYAILKEINIRRRNKRQIDSYRFSSSLIEDWCSSFCAVLQWLRTLLVVVLIFRPLVVWICVHNMFLKNFNISLCIIYYISLMCITNLLKNSSPRWKTTDPTNCIFRVYLLNIKENHAWSHRYFTSHLKTKFAGLNIFMSLEH